MLKYTLKRFVYMIITIWIVITITFVMMHSIPGNPFSTGRSLSPQTKINLNKRYGLDKPLPAQYAIFLKNLVFHGSLGESYTYPGLTVNSIIVERAPVSAALGAEALIFALVIGMTFGIIAAFKRNHWQDYLVMIIAILGIAIPSFVLAALLQYFLTVKIEILPTSGWGGFKYTILPALSLSLGIIAVYARYMRSSCIDVLGQDYIMTAKAKGVSKVPLIWKHVTRNAILPAITILGQQIAAVLTGTFVIESVFSIPGIGRYFVTSITNRDYPIILGTTIFVAVVYIISVYLVDILYSLVDPRIRLSSNKK
ncbi:oligopeptide transport system permease protein [Clostridium acetobutylicum]|uniref:Oligopeptide ABC transporter, permease component n=1 Tax=Clostridium acetobutylicum (strain ATCC 824 / DSM 792 / JCM 1419 / IAM 19013 / LMG 5710 / NBRC 13948 / NRRL B-527 / VKM B-1787 / 2291 / W) TaxID=272562 RepID=Q97D49_CLOAB|nr:MULTISPECIES: ABC transporter permease [Clostridium]AAK81554.1 Oligopeptide ABC transporter, permease component [Clostridium acetobutylicum ATCC 824]ADZ22675.1 Oligopeptide ABC transporter, permease component [Clostridium acetobutylicum EA 2018]AEI34335.1 oligopeptide ABC transporter, permease component [Clostridium acetobutylicum DSM 1731]AWV80773.1 ABC transporter permease [Clostridium acetobutylicum]MBC2393902.1 ABC transporter permease [Clostridium acetobutylicum]